MRGGRGVVEFSCCNDSRLQFMISFLRLNNSHVCTREGFLLMLRFTRRSLQVPCRRNPGLSPVCRLCLALLASRSVFAWHRTLARGLEVLFAGFGDRESGSCRVLLGCLMAAVNTPYTH
ncbi:hypothetical protein BaRGS_00009553 [Batillaria attramentaria]|uniref:Uncharacterized protein n=1 Tax=Batillaria attramentaria TaxID=370345 RepID=A0ABD0LJK4_9CAEN